MSTPLMYRRNKLERATVPFTLLNINGFVRPTSRGVVRNARA